MKAGSFPAGASSEVRQAQRVTRSRWVRYRLNQPDHAIGLAFGGKGLSWRE
jgi:hypothetical protein